MLNLSRVIKNVDKCFPKTRKTSKNVHIGTKTVALPWGGPQGLNLSWKKSRRLLTKAPAKVIME